jgi:hypothetical protein
MAPPIPPPEMHIVGNGQDGTVWFSARWDACAQPPQWVRLAVKYPKPQRSLFSEIRLLRKLAQQSMHPGWPHVIHLHEELPGGAYSVCTVHYLVAAGAWATLCFLTRAPICQMEFVQSTLYTLCGGVAAGPHSVSPSLNDRVRLVCESALGLECMHAAGICHRYCTTCTGALSTSPCHMCVHYSYYCTEQCAGVHPRVRMVHGALAHTNPVAVTAGTATPTTSW